MIALDISFVSRQTPDNSLSTVSERSITTRLQVGKKYKHNVRQSGRSIIEILKFEETRRRSARARAHLQSVARKSSRRALTSPGRSSQRTRLLTERTYDTASRHQNGSYQFEHLKRERETELKKKQDKRSPH